jgi:hypothetical protein
MEKSTYILGQMATSPQFHLLPTRNISHGPFFFNLLRVYTYVYILLLYVYVSSSCQLALFGYSD